MGYKINSVRRGQLPSGSDIATLADADYLIVSIFNDVDGLVTTIELYESDYAGLIAEFDAGSATTILESSVASAFSGTVSDELSATQETWRGNYTPTV